MECRMIYNCAFILCLTLLPIIKAEELTLENCHCDGFYKPVKVEDGTIWCSSRHYGTYRVPCNVKHPPRCKCTGENKPDIIIDENGIWCVSKTKEGAEKLWECENKEEREAAIKKIIEAGGVILR